MASPKLLFGAGCASSSGLENLTLVPHVDFLNKLPKAKYKAMLKNIKLAFTYLFINQILSVT
ncbi:MAG: hypothetical protein ORN55_05155 [Chitinophagaceae bacterium]|jgi:hypothetical protein|nr:hypothetical protein [Chitinophagaceae bacterium]